MVEVTPLLPSERKSAGRGRTVVIAVAALALVGAAAVVSHMSSSSRAALLADGVEPVSKLSFTRAEKSHFKAANRLDDVSSRSAVDSYFGRLDASEEKQHDADERQAKRATSKQQSLNSYFDSLGASYAKEASRHMQARAARHPGKLAHAAKARYARSIAKESDAKGEARSEANTAEESSSQLTSASKVKIGFYMESMCPGCKYYTTHVLKALMEKKEFRQMVEVEVYPYGNGQLSGTQIACQHGADECEGNKVIACMQKLYPITEADAGFFPAFACMEAKNGKPVTEGETCANDNNLDWSQIQTCVAGTEGSSLALSAAQATEGLSPAHEYAPWLTLNESPMRDDAYNLAAKVCDAYTGMDKPSMCSADAVKADEGQALRVINDIGFSVCPRVAGKV